MFPSQGTTAFLATVIFPRDQPDKITSVLASLAKCVGEVTGSGAVVEGVHAEVNTPRQHVQESCHQVS